MEEKEDRPKYSHEASQLARATRKKLGELGQTGDSVEMIKDQQAVTGSRLTGMDEFVLKVMRLFKNGRVYVTLEQRGMIFQAAFMAVVKTDGKIYSDTYVTGELSVGMSLEQAMRDADIVARSLASGLAHAIFLGKRSPVDEKAAWLPEMKSL